MNVFFYLDHKKNCLPLQLRESPRYQNRESESRAKKRLRKGLVLTPGFVPESQSSQNLIFSITVFVSVCGTMALVYNECPLCLCPFSNGPLTVIQTSPGSNTAIRVQE
jgi:hypothetical protein